MAATELLISIKEQAPTLSVRRVIERARATGKLPADLSLPPSTVPRLLAREGLMLKRTDVPSGADRWRFGFRYADEPWMATSCTGSASAMLTAGAVKPT